MASKKQITRTAATLSASVEHIAQSILLVRGYKVLLDSDLAALYGVETKVLLQSVRRNLERFPKDFMMQLTPEEWDSLRSQIVTLKMAGRGNIESTCPTLLPSKA